MYSIHNNSRMSWQLIVYCNSGPLDQSIGKLFHFIEKCFTPHKIIHIKEKWKEKNIHIYMFPLLLILVRTFQLKQKWFFFRTEMLQQAEMERKNIHIYMYPFPSACEGRYGWITSAWIFFISNGNYPYLSQNLLAIKKRIRSISL